MTKDKTVTMSRELAERLDSPHSSVRNAAIESLRRILANPDAGITASVAAQSELAALREELAKTYRAASELANAMTRDVADLSPEFELFDYTCGVIGQIDNMYAGMRADRNALKQRLAAAGQRNATLTKAISDAEYRADQGKVWNGMGWTYTGLHSHGQQKVLDILRTALQPTESGASE